MTKNMAEIMKNRPLVKQKRAQEELIRASGKKAKKVKIPFSPFR